jgi:hypothetical protein
MHPPISNRNEDARLLKTAYFKRCGRFFFIEGKALLCGYMRMTVC